MTEGQATRKEYTIGELLSPEEVTSLSEAVANLALAGLRFQEAGASARYNQAMALVEHLMQVIDCAIVEEDVPVAAPAS